MSIEWNEKAVYLAALDLTPEDQEAFLRGACPEPGQYERIMALLLHAHGAEAEDPVAISSQSSGTAGDASGGPAQLDEFQIVRTLGQGGMGMVYLAEDLVLGRQVAIKVVSQYLTHSERAVARFTSEARIAAKLNHPGIVPVHKFGFDGRNHYLVCEFVDGPTLSEEITGEREARLEHSTTQDIRRWQTHAIETIAAIADALDSAHRLGVVHRDVKPSNILIDANLGPRLTDFGIAIQVEAEATTRSYEVMGSCYYMSPEQANGGSDRVDHRSDIFSLGVVLYEMLMFQRPFDGQDVNTVLRGITTLEPKRLRLIDRRISRDLEVVTLKCLEKKPEDRYQSAAHLAADLRCVLSHQPIMARPPGIVRRSVRLAKQRRGAVVAVVVFVLVAALSGMVFDQMRRTKATYADVVFNVTEEHGDLAFLLRRWDIATGEYGPAERFSNAPGNHLSIPPGSYRFIVHGASGQFIDFDDTLLTGTSKEYFVPTLPQQTADVTQGMVFFEPPQSADDSRTNDFQYATYTDPADGLKKSSYPMLGGFWLDIAEVSNAEYKEFVDATNARVPEYWGNIDFAKIADKPVVSIRRDEALAYALWRGKRLPTVYEWLYAAQMPGGITQEYPWSPNSVPDEAKVTSEMIVESQDHSPEALLQQYLTYVVAVRSHPSLCTPTGLYHMFGNVRELTSTVVKQESGLAAVIAGGTWSTALTSGGYLEVRSYPLGNLVGSFGFRCARSATDSLSIPPQ